MMKKNFISRGLQSNKYGTQLNPVATGALEGLAPKRSSKSPKFKYEAL